MSSNLQSVLQEVTNSSIKFVTIEIHINKSKMGGFEMFQFSKEQLEALTAEITTREFANNQNYGRKHLIIIQKT